MKTVRNFLKPLVNRVDIHLANIFATRLTQPVLVIESDDWGAIRLRDQESLGRMERAGLNIKQSKLNSFDCLERRDDLEALLDTLANVRNRRGTNPVMTLNTVLFNPDFDAISASDFSVYSSEPFFHSYTRYYDEDLQPIWKHGIEQGLIVPQFHAREHLNVELWMRDLQNGHPETREAFRNNFFAHRTKTGSFTQKHYVAAYSPETPAELEKVKSVVVDGLDAFENVFGFRSRSFIGCNYVWPEELESLLNEHGVCHIQTRRKHHRPNPYKSGARTIHRKSTGMKNRFGQTYGVRNVIFEPFEAQQNDWVSSAMREISNAFFFNAPAILCTHRANYCSHINKAHAARSLDLLSQLLNRIVDRWPNVQFLSTDQLATALRPPQSLGQLAKN